MTALEFLETVRDLVRAAVPNVLHYPEYVRFHLEGDYELRIRYSAHKTHTEALFVSTSPALFVSISPRGYKPAGETALFLGTTDEVKTTIATWAVRQPEEYLTPILCHLVNAESRYYLVNARKEGKHGAP